MMPPRRLLDEGTPFERDVLASMRLDSGLAGGLVRTLAAMRLGAAAATSEANMERPQAKVLPRAMAPSRLPRN